MATDSGVVPHGDGHTDGNPEAAGVDSSRLDRIAQWQHDLVKDRRLPSTHVIISRRGRVVYNHWTGYRRTPALDGTSALPLAGNDIYRMYSMSKPIVSVALMQLIERGDLLLSDPVWKYLGPRWKKKSMTVLVPGSFDADSNEFKTEPCRNTITVQMLLTHTSGLSYGFDTFGVANKVDLLYEKAKLQRIENLRQFCDELASQPLLFQPGECWWYGYNTDVVGAIVESISGTSLEAYLQENILRPLRMRDTSFWIHPEQRVRVPQIYMRRGQRPGMIAIGTSKITQGLKDISDALHEYEQAHIIHWADSPQNKFNSGGGGLAGTVNDYMRFARSMLNGGELDGARILSRKSVQTMISNQIGRDVYGEPIDMRMKSSGVPLESYSEIGEKGAGFGLGFSVILRADMSSYAATEGSFSWGGAGSTLFWCDPVEDLAVVFATSFRFRDDFELPLRGVLSNLVYATLIDGDASGPSAKL